MNQERQETMLQYVVRKLNDGIINKSEVARRTGIDPANISRIASGKSSDPQHSTVEKIYQCLKESEQ